MGMIENAKNLVGITSDPVEIARKRLETARADRSIMEKEAEQVKAELVKAGEEDYENGRPITGVKPWAEIDHRIKVIEKVILKREQELAAAEVQQRKDREADARKRWTEARERYALPADVVRGLAYLVRTHARAFNLGIQVNGLGSYQAAAEGQALGGNDPEADAAIAELRELGCTVEVNPSGSVYRQQAASEVTMAALFPSILKAMSKLAGGFDYQAYAESVPDPVVMAAQAATKAAEVREAFHTAVVKASQAFPSAHKVEDIAASPDLYSKAHNIRQWCTDHQVPAAKLDALCNSAYELAEKNLSGTRTWSVDRHVLAAAISWQGPLPS